MAPFSWLHWLRSLKTSRGRTFRRQGLGDRRRRSSRLELEPLESRLAPATFTWTGGGGSNTNWSNPSNWGGVAPKITDTPDLVFPTLATAQTPRLQDVLDPAAPFDVTVHDGFEFWVDGVAELDDEGKASLERANSAAVPTSRVAGVASAYWCRIGERPADNGY